MTAVSTTVACFRLRTLVRWGVLAAVGVGLVQTWLIDGLVAPYRVAGGSMAGALLGVHRDVVCSDCGHRFSCGTDRLPVAARAVCPNCGYAANDLEQLPDVRGDRVLIDRASLAIRPPRRWEIVAFHPPQQADRIAIKRVVGLPGESIAIRHGDVYVDGHIQRKDLAQQRALAVLVHDADCQPKHEPLPPPRWQAERTDSRWNAVNRGFVHPAAPNSGQIGWLAYRHWRRLVSGEVQESPVIDLCGYNPSQPRREEDVHAVTDLLLSFRLRHVSGRGSLFVRIADGSYGFQARLHFDDDPQQHLGLPVRCATVRLQAGHGQRVTHWREGGQTVADGQIPATNAERLVEVSLVDQQFLLAVDGQTVMCCPYDRPEPPEIPMTCPIAIGAEGVEVMVRNLRLFRDVYYTHPIGLRGSGLGDRAVRLGANEYYVLGDNSPISEDSRTWLEHGAIDHKSLLEKTLVAIPSTQLSPWDGWHFQVPNPTGIRYIR